MTSADFSTASSALMDAAVPSHPAITPSATGHPETPAETSPDKTSTLPRTPTASTQRPLMTSGFAVVCRLARTAPPSTRSPRSPARHVFLESRFRLRLPSHPASRRRSCPRLVVGAINLHRGLPPPSCWSCRAYKAVQNPSGFEQQQQLLLLRQHRRALHHIRRLDYPGP